MTRNLLATTPVYGLTVEFLHLLSGGVSYWSKLKCLPRGHVVVVDDSILLAFTDPMDDYTLAVWFHYAALGPEELSSAQRGHRRKRDKCQEMKAWRMWRVMRQQNSESLLWFRKLEIEKRGVLFCKRLGRWLSVMGQIWLICCVILTPACYEVTVGLVTTGGSFFLTLGGCAINVSSRVLSHGTSGP